MKTILRRILAAGAGAAVIMGAAAVVRADGASAALNQAAPAPAAPSTFWNLLGIPQGMHKLRDARLNRLGNNPDRERVPPLKRIADPANLQSKNPAIAAAAKIKKDQDLAPQKIKALKYLGTIACCCPANKEEIKNALLAALDDCTDEVREAAALAICHAAANPCPICNQCSCCRADVMNKLNAMANEQDETGCWKEPNPAVRQAAAMALEACRQARGPEPAPAAPPPAPAAPKERLLPRPPADPGYSTPQSPSAPSAPGANSPTLAPKSDPNPAPKPAQKSADGDGWKVRPAADEESPVGVAVIVDETSRPAARPRAATRPQPVIRPQGTVQPQAAMPPQAAIQPELTIRLQPPVTLQPPLAPQRIIVPTEKPMVKLEIPAKPAEPAGEATIGEPKLLSPAAVEEPKVLIKLSGGE